MYRLIIYDTSNFVDFPIGGQLTSICHFLKYLGQYHPEVVADVLLVGITNDASDVGKLQSVSINGCRFPFLPVLFRERDLASVKGSLRVAYLKALFQYIRRIRCNKNTVHYIHTPEAFIAVKLLHPRGKTAVFSHGSFFNMVEGFRFFQNNKLVHVLFNQFIVALLKSADLIFTIDDPSTEQYRKYTNKVCRAENSIVIPEVESSRKIAHTPIRLLFAGRLSKVKRIEPIIEAVSAADGAIKLTILGDGEERTSLEMWIRDQNAEENVEMMGSVPPSEMEKYLRKNDILIMNSIFEGKPMAILEAMSFGLPVVTTPVGGIPEMVTQGQSAEFTDGTAMDILKKVQVVEENYAHYSREARTGSEKYDYRYVNASIWRALSDI